MKRRKEQVYEIKYMSPRPININDEFYIVVDIKRVDIAEAEDHYAFSANIYAYKFGVVKIKIRSCEMDIDYRDLLIFHAASEDNKFHEYFSIKEFCKRHNRPGNVEIYTGFTKQDIIRREYKSGIYDNYDLALKEAERINADVQGCLDAFNQKYGTKFSIKE